MASYRIEQYIQNDCEFRSLSDLLHVVSDKAPTVSGLKDVDYPNSMDNGNRVPLTSNITTVPTPADLVEQFTNMEHNCELGLFTEISRAWLSVDSNIFLWAYDNGGDVAYYDGIEQTIIGVCLAKPKPKVFKPHIKYLLCLTTSSEITLLAVTFNDDNPNPSNSAVLLVPDPVFRIATDNIRLTIIASTDDGRIFLGGHDGCLYEIVYQAEGGWFGRSCRKVNHSTSLLSYVMPSFLNFSELEPIVQIEIDNERHLLYTRSIKSTIQMFDLGSDGQQMSRVVSRPLSSIVNQASCIARTIDNNNFKPIISIKALYKNESSKLHLMAMTQAGVRLYFAAKGDRPTGLELVHVRLPPGFTPSSIMQKPTAVNNLYYKDSTLIMTSFQSEDKDFLWVLSNDAYVHENQMMETFNVNSLNGRVWTVSEEINPTPVMARFANNKPPALATQHFEDRRKFVLLTSQGVHIIYKNRPIDLLSRLLMENQNHEALPVRQFFQSIKLSEACLTSLIIACTSKLPQESQLAELATLAFFRYGSGPRAFRVPSMSTPISSPNQSLLPSNMSPIASFMNTSANMPGDRMEVQFSARHDAIFLYLTRILRPLWHVRVSMSQSISPGHDCLVNTVELDELSLYLKRLTELKQFLASSMQFNTDNNISANLKTNNRNEPADAASQERESTNALSQLLDRCTEVMHLYRLLCEHQFDLICTNLPVEKQNQLHSMTFRDLITVEHDMTTLLAGALVRRYLDDNITTDSISRKLHDVCPSIFKQENALYAKANEIIIRAQNLTDKIDRDRMINEAVNLFKKIGARINLQNACDLLHSTRAYRHIVDLCLYIADKRDPQNLTSYYHKTLIQANQDGNFQNGDDNNSQAAQAAHGRVDCYMKVIETLDRLMNISKSAILTPMNLSNHEELMNHHNQVVSVEDAKSAFDDVMNSAVQSTDELFHNKLYEWLCENNLSSKLLDLQSAYLENFLKKKTSSSLESIPYLDLMWRYYEKQNSFAQAAQVLERLASKATVDYALHKRLEYLSRAIICMQSTNPSMLVTDKLQKSTPGEFLHKLEEKMEVARIQHHVLERIKDLPETTFTQEAMNHLNYELLDLSQLYEDFAEKFKLQDCQLSILKSAGHYDKALIENLWQSIMDNVIRECSHEPGETQIVLLSNKIKNLAHEFIPSDRYFPAFFVLSYLEYRTHHLENTQWIHKTFMEVGFSFINLLDIYHKFYKSRDQVTYWPQKAIHLLTVLADLIGKFANKPSEFPAHQRPTIASTCLDVICGYLIDLQTMSSADRNVRRLQDEYRNLQARINLLHL